MTDQPLADNTPNPYSFKGWSLKDWAKGNKDSIKLLVTALAAYGAYVADFVQNPALKAATIGVVAAVVKLGLDSFDYWLSD